MTVTQRETLHDLFAVIGRTSAATSEQRQRANHLAQRMEIAEFLRNVLGNAA